MSRFCLYSPKKIQNKKETTTQRQWEKGRGREGARTSGGLKVLKRGGVRNPNLETHSSKYPTLEEVLLPTYPIYPP